MVTLLLFPPLLPLRPSVWGSVSHPAPTPFYERGWGGVEWRNGFRRDWGATVIDLDVLVSSILRRADLVDLLRRELAVDSGDLVTVARAAELRGVSPKTIRNWLSSGRLTRHGDTRAPLVDRSELTSISPLPAAPIVRGRNAKRAFTDRVSNGR